MGFYLKLIIKQVSVESGKLKQHPASYQKGMEQDTGDNRNYTKHKLMQINTTLLNGGQVKEEIKKGVNCFL